MFKARLRQNVIGNLKKYSHNGSTSKYTRYHRRAEKPALSGGANLTRVMDSTLRATCTNVCKPGSETKQGERQSAAVCSNKVQNR
jgi:hypothetical protein